MKVVDFVWVIGNQSRHVLAALRPPLDIGFTQCQHIGGHLVGQPPRLVSWCAVRPKERQALDLTCPPQPYQSKVEVRGQDYSKGFEVEWE